MTETYYIEFECEGELRRITPGYARRKEALESGVAFIMTRAGVTWRVTKVTSYDHAVHYSEPEVQP